MFLAVLAAFALTVSTVHSANDYSEDYRSAQQTSQPAVSQTLSPSHHDTLDDSHPFLRYPRGGPGRQASIGSTRS
jgi:hypothetical protein